MRDSRVEDTKLRTMYQRGLDWKLMLTGIGILGLGHLFLIISNQPPGGASHLGIVLMSVGFVLTAASAYLFHRRLPRPNWDPRFTSKLTLATHAGQRTGVFVGVVAYALLVIRLLGGSESANDLWLWFIAIIGIVGGFAPSMRRTMVGIRRATRSLRLVDVVVVSIIMSIFVTINAPDLTDPYYLIGDEYAFYERMKSIVDVGLKRPFTLDGVYIRHPMLGIATKSVVMNMVGADHFGWKFSSVALVALTIPGLYVLGTTIEGRIAGTVASAMFAFCHYIFAMVHIGYDHADSLMPVVWTMVVFALGARRGNPLLLLIAGILVGFCFYTMVAARLALPLAMLFILLNPSSASRIRPLMYIAGGFLLALIPALIVNGTNFITFMIVMLVGRQGEASDLSLPARVLANFELNLLAFHFNERVSHYVSGPLFDPISAFVAAVGLAFMFGMFRDPAARLLCFWFGIAFVSTGLGSPYPHVAITRMFPVVVPMALASGLFVSRFLWPIDINIRSLSSGKTLITPKFAIIIALVFVVLTILLLNVQRFSSDTPEVFQSHPVGVGISAMQSEHCGQFERERIAFLSRDEHLLRRILDSFEPGSVQIFPGENSEVSGSPTFFNHQQALVDGIPEVSRFGCVILTHTWGSETATALNNLYAANPQGTIVPFSDQSGKTTVTIFKPY